MAFLIIKGCCKCEVTNGLSSSVVVSKQKEPRRKKHVLKFTFFSSLTGVVKKDKKRKRTKKGEQLPSQNLTKMVTYLVGM